MGSSSVLEEIAVSRVLGLGLVLGIILVFLFWPLLIRFMPGIRHCLPFHYRPVSDIPGVEIHYDYAIISALCTLPDPHNQIAAYSYVPLVGGVRLRVKKLQCKYHSVSLYAGIFDPKNTQQDLQPPSLAGHEIIYNDEAERGGDAYYDIVISDQKPPDSDKVNWLPRQVFIKNR